MNNPIEFLTFSGGGGKGIVYLGAIKALEEKGLLPIPQTSLDISFSERFINKKIKGISGSSAGAITAFLLAMGLDSEKIGEIMMREFNGINRFLTFFDDPKEFIHQKPKNEKEIENLIGKQRSIEINENEISLKSIESFYPKEIFSKALTNALLYSTNKYLDLKYNISDNLLLERLLRNSSERDYFIANLLYGKGIFNGFSIRSFFSELISEFLIEPNREFLEKNARSFPFIKAKTPAHGVTIKQFLYLTATDFRVTGVNLNDKKSYYFSSFHTPDFPIIEAVAISMNLPILFRPITVKSEKRSGEWIDGGLINNYPIHAFDNVLREYDNTAFPGSNILSSSFAKDYNFDELSKLNLPFNEKVLGFTLSEGFPSDIDDKLKVKWKKRFAVQEESSNNFIETFEKYIGINPITLPINKVKSINDIYNKYIREKNIREQLEKGRKQIKSIQIIDLFEKIYKSFLFPANEGQIKSIIESERTIDLLTYNIELTEFAPFANPNKIFLSIDSNKNDNHTTPVHFAYHTVLEKLKEFD